MKYIEKRTLSDSALRTLCAKYHFYTASMDGWVELFNLIGDLDTRTNITTDLIAELATNIYNRSDLTDERIIPEIMCELAKACVSEFQEVQ